MKSSRSPAPALEALKRSDEAEGKRLFDSAPTRTIDLKHHQLGEAALHTIALVYVSEQLEAAGYYFFAAMKLVAGGKNLEDDELRFLLFCYDVHACVFRVKAQAWRKACEGSGLDPDHLVKSNCLAGCCPIARARWGRWRRAGSEWKDASATSADPLDLKTIESEAKCWGRRFGTALRDLV